MSIYNNFIFFITLNNTIWCIYLQVSFRFVAPARRALRGSTPNYVVATYYFANEDCIENFTFQRLGGVEPLHQAWEARILPLYYSRVGKVIIAEKRRECKHARRLYFRRCGKQAYRLRPPFIHAGILLYCLL